MGSCVSKAPEEAQRTVDALQSNGHAPPVPTSGQGVGSLIKKSFRSTHRSVIEGLASIYTIKTVLGSGCEGKTWLCQDLTTGYLWAIKMVKLPLHTKMVQAIFREIRIQSELGEGHINIITPQELVLTSHYLGLVMEYAPGGSLTQYVTRKWKETGGHGLLMQEDEALYFFKQLVYAVDYCHRHHVVHRDLKLDNTLLSAHSPPYIKICDFGFARGWGEDASFNTIIGTPDYMAPQLTAAKVNKSEAKYDGCKADVWSMGVLLCVMLLGKFPFDDSGPMQDAMKTVYMQQHSYASWRDNPLLADLVALLGPEATDMLDRIFERDENKRITLQAIQTHPWFTRVLPPYYQVPLDALLRDQAELERRMVAGANKSKERDSAIANLIRMACSDDFKQQATAPLTPDYTFQLYQRINLRTVAEQYPVFNRTSLKAMIKAESRRNSMRSTQRPKINGANWDGGVSPPQSGMYPQSTGMYGPQSGNGAYPTSAGMYGPTSGTGMYPQSATGMYPQSGTGMYPQSQQIFPASSNYNSQSGLTHSGGMQPGMMQQASNIHPPNMQQPGYSPGYNQQQAGFNSGNMQHSAGHSQQQQNVHGGAGGGTGGGQMAGPQFRPPASLQGLAVEGTFALNPGYGGYPTDQQQQQRGAPPSQQQQRLPQQGPQSQGVRFTPPAGQVPGSFQPGGQMQGPGTSGMQQQPLQQQQQFAQQHQHGGMQQQQLPNQPAGVKFRPPASVTDLQQQHLAQQQQQYQQQQNHVQQQLPAAARPAGPDTMDMSRGSGSSAGGVLIRKPSDDVVMQPASN